MHQSNQGLSAGLLDFLFYIRKRYITVLQGTVTALPGRRLRFSCYCQCQTFVVGLMWIKIKPMLLKNLFFFALLLTGKIAIGQNSVLSKDQLYKIFKSSIRQGVRKKILVGSNSWLICNSDSSFYSSDTITLINGDIEKYFKHCCESIEWTFYRKNSFTESKRNLCQEPVYSDERVYFFKIQVVQRQNNLFIDVMKFEELIHRFKVLSFQEMVDSRALVLLRTVH